MRNGKTKQELEKELRKFSKIELIALAIELLFKLEIYKIQRGLNSQNSSKPPSTDPPEVKAKRKPKKKSKRKPGGQPGHKGHHRELVPTEEVDEIKTVVPVCCKSCGKKLKGQDSNPQRHQVYEIPTVKPTVTEYQLHTLHCECCNTNTKAELPRGVPQGAFGKSIISIIALFTGVYRISKRGVVQLLDDLFSLPIGLGSVCNAEKTISAALTKPYEEAKEQINSENVLHADETSWREGNNKAWLWVAVTSRFTVFMIHLKRNQVAARALLSKFKGVLVTDRYSAYNRHTGKRQFCWAHLLRDFKRFSELGGLEGKVGRDLLSMTEKMFKMFNRVRDGTLQRKTFILRMRSHRAAFEALLWSGANVCQGSISGSCKRLLKHASYLWTFVDNEDVEPTNNIAERAVRFGVIWRKICFGTHSSVGSRFVERILTVSATCKQQGRNVLDYLRSACSAHFEGGSF